MSYLSQLAAAFALTLAITGTRDLQAADTYNGQSESGLKSKEMDQALQEKSQAKGNLAATQPANESGVVNKIKANEQKLQDEMIHGNAPATAVGAGMAGMRNGEEVKAGTTQENLQTAYDKEKKAQRLFMAFARKAEQEDYPQVANLFRAASQGCKVGTKAIAKLTNKTEAATEPAESKMDDRMATAKEALEARTTKENLEWLKNDIPRVEKMYDSFYEVAEKDNNAEAMQIFKYGREAVKSNGKLFSKHLDDLDNLKGKQGEPFFYCPDCGYIVAQSEKTFEKCPVSETLVEKFKEATKNGDTTAGENGATNDATE